MTPLYSPRASLPVELPLIDPALLIYAPIMTAEYETEKDGESRESPGMMPLPGFDHQPAARGERCLPC